MNTNKQQYLEQIRSNTAYPTYRGIIGIIAVLGYVFAGLSALGALGTLISGQGFFRRIGFFLVGLIVTALIFFGVRFWKEAALILADIGDSITDTNSKTQSKE